MSKLLWRRDGLFDFQWCIGFGGSVVKSRKAFFKALDVKAPKDSTTGIVVARFVGVDDCKSGLLWFGSKRPKPHVVAHECSHAVDYFLAELGIEQPGTEFTEIRAYYLEFLVKMIGRLVRK